MNASELGVVIAAAVAAAAAGYIVTRRSSAGPHATSSSAGAGSVAPVPGASAPPSGPTDGPSGWASKLFGEWSGLITTAGTLAAALGTYQLTKDIGKGDLTRDEHIHVIVAAGCFALGIGLLITIPVSLRTRNRVMISDAVTSQRRWNRLAWLTRGKFKRRIVPSSSLFGYDDLVAFDEAIKQLATAIRSHWEDGFDPPAELRGRQEVFRRQREQIEDLVATRRLRSASRRAVTKAAAGMVLAVAGYVDATFITNQGQRDAELADSAVEHARAVENEKAAQINKIEDTELAQANDVDDVKLAHRNELEKLILVDSLADVVATQVLPAVPSPVTVTIPDVATAAQLFGVDAGTINPTCTSQREGTALDVGAPPQNTPTERILFVAFPRTAACAAGAGWVDPAWLAASAAPLSSDVTVTSDGG